MHALATGRADEREIVQGRNARDASFTGESRKIKRQIQQIVNVEHVGLDVVENGPERFVDPGRLVALFETRKSPVVDELDDRQALVCASQQTAMSARLVVLGAEDLQLMATDAERPAQLESVDLRAGPVMGKKVVNGMQDVQFNLGPPGVFPISSMSGIVFIDTTDVKNR